MSFISPRSILIALTLACGLLRGQTPTQNISLVTSTYSVMLPAGFTGASFSFLELEVSYPANLSPSTYVPYQQLISDFQGFISAYPSPTDAPEAYLSVALQQLLNKYPQISGGLLIGEGSGSSTIPGLPGQAPPGASVVSVTVEIGNFGSILGLTTGQIGSISIVSSSRTLTLPANFTGTAFSTITLDLTYPTGLANSSYIGTNQLNSDFQGFLSAYPTPTDPPEAYLSTTFQQMLTKYPQIAGGSLAGSVNGPGTTIPGTTFTIPGPQIGSVTVTIGNYSALTFGLLPTQTATVSSITSSWAVTLPSGFAGTALSNINLVVYYPTGLAANSYILNTQLISDFQAFVSANSAAAVEGYLSAALQQILNKYPQMPLGRVGGQIGGSGTPTMPAQPVGTVSVEIGNTSAITGLLPSTNAARSLRRAKPISSR